MNDLFTRFKQISAGEALAAPGGLLTLSLLGVSRFGRSVPEVVSDRGRSTTAGV